ncbi:MAG: type II toxin-antitoxin system RelE/ParE family toxin [Legionellales bacterium]|nr:type II toxin-antitoxin system RelE/ParE family toxin [Legionellales bacterium]
MNTIIWSRKARKQLLKIAKKEASVIYDKVGELVNFPHCQQVKKLVNHPHGYRLRVGHYRVLFNYDGDIQVIQIEEVKKRDESTY